MNEAGGGAYASAGRLNDTGETMGKYLTVARETSAEQTIEKSRFIAYIKHVENREEADAFISEIRTLHRDARHNVPAFVLGKNSEIQWASDDGEPSGTSGAPVLKLLTSNGLTDVAVVVTRYFGGIKLGTGGLMRAYTGVVRDVLEKAGRCEMADLDVMTVRVTYQQFDRINRMASEGGFEISDTYYDDRVTLSLCAEESRTERIINMLSDLTAGEISENSIKIKKISKLIEIQY